MSVCGQNVSHSAHGRIAFIFSADWRFQEFALTSSGKLESQTSRHASTHISGERDVPSVDNVYIRLFQVEICLLYPDQWRLQDMQSSFWRFYMNFDDGASVDFGGEIIPLRARELYFIPAGVCFDTQTTHRVTQFYVHFDVLGLPGFVARELFHRPIRLNAPDALRTETLELARYFKSGRSADLPCHLRIKSLLYSGLAQYIQALPAEQIAQYQSTMRVLEPVLPAIRFIESNPAAPLSNRELAQRCHMSESYFIRRFHECVQQTPKQYLLERRVQIAAQQLLFSNHSIDRIAAETGFGNRFYFSRIFAQKTGVTPAAYRKATKVN
jgi:AraC-like DNA-binding protein